MTKPANLINTDDQKSAILSLCVLITSMLIQLFLMLAGIKALFGNYDYTVLKTISTAIASATDSTSTGNFITANVVILTGMIVQFLSLFLTNLISTKNFAIAFACAIDDFLAPFKALFAKKANE